jgi:type I restriction enzyme M protein
MGEYGVSKIFAQEKNITTYNLARMNMLLHGVKDNEFNISHGDSLTNEWDILSETNPANKTPCGRMIAIVPSSSKK